MNIHRRRHLPDTLPLLLRWAIQCVAQKYCTKKKHKFTNKPKIQDKMLAYSCGGNGTSRKVNKSIANKLQPNECTPASTSMILKKRFHRLSHISTIWNILHVSIDITKNIVSKYVQALLLCLSDVIFYC